MLNVFIALLLTLTSATALAGPKLYVLDCGLKDEETPVRELFVPCYVVEHEKGRLLWDAGLPLKAAGNGGERVDAYSHPKESRGQST